jgi:hypothetical protein
MIMKPNESSAVDAAPTPDCFGHLSPDFSKLDYNHKAAGRAFDVLIESAGASVQRKTVTFKPEAWTKCAASPRFDECYRLSIAKLLLELKLDHYT